MPQNLTVLEGDQAVLNCSAKAESASIKFVWFTKPNREIVQDGDRVEILEDGPLVFHTLKKEDEGFYQCSVKVEDSKMTKTTNTHWAYLRVHGELGSR